MHKVKLWFFPKMSFKFYYGLGGFVSTLVFLSVAHELLRPTEIGFVESLSLVLVGANPSVLWFAGIAIVLFPVSGFMLGWIIDQFNELNQFKNKLIGIAAHDLKNPIGAISSYTEILLEEADKNDTQSLEFLNRMRVLSQKMLALISDLLDVTKIESGTLSLDLKPCILGEFLERTIEFNQMISRRKGIEIRLNLSCAPIVLPLDEPRFEQVINNLLSNAIKFSRSGTEIEVSVSLHQTDAVIKVKDHGQGIPGSEIPTLFQPFKTGSTKSTANEKSTGLGLFIVRRIVELHSGSVTLESEHGLGTTVTVRLPGAKLLESAISIPESSARMPELRRHAS